MDDKSKNRGCFLIMILLFVLLYIRKENNRLTVELTNCKYQPFKSLIFDTHQFKTVNGFKTKYGEPDEKRTWGYNNYHDGDSGIDDIYKNASGEFNLQNETFSFNNSKELGELISTEKNIVCKGKRRIYINYGGQTHFVFQADGNCQISKIEYRNTFK